MSGSDDASVEQAQGQCPSEREYRGSMHRCAKGEGHEGSCVGSAGLIIKDAARCGARVGSLVPGSRVRCNRRSGHDGPHGLVSDAPVYPLPFPIPKPFVRSLDIEKAPRDVVLDTAKGLISGERAQTYGDPTESHRRIGKIWGAILGADDIPPATVALMMAGLKVSRAVGDPTHQDSWVDLAGYAALGYEAARKDAS